MAIPPHSPAAVLPKARGIAASAMSHMSHCRQRPRTPPRGPLPLRPGSRRRVRVLLSVALDQKATYAPQQRPSLFDHFVGRHSLNCTHYGCCAGLCVSPASLLRTSPLWPISRSVELFRSRQATALARCRLAPQAASVILGSTRARLISLFELVDDLNRSCRWPACS
jgi:hypothetical protein